MYKNKIKNRLEKINYEFKDLTFRKEDKGNTNSSGLFLKSNRKTKLSLSKDITVQCNQQQKSSLDKDKKKYLKVISKQKLITEASSPSKNQYIDTSKSRSYKHSIKRSIFQEVDQNNKDKANITKSTVTLNQQIVPFSLMNEDQDQDRKSSNSYIFKTPIRMLRSNQGQNQQTTQLINKESQSANHYRNKHRINLSPNPIKKSESSKQLKVDCSYNSFLCQSKSSMLQQSNRSQISQIANKLNEIHLKRKAIQQRISSQLDKLSQKAGLSAPKQFNQSQEQHIKKHKILCPNTNINTPSDKNPSSKIKQYKQSIKQKDKNLRNLIMNRIYS